MFASRIATVLMLGAFLLTSPVSAQNSFGKIVGVVLDGAGAAVVGATLKVINTATGVVHTVRPQSNGSYTAIHLIPGLYVVGVEAPGCSQSQTISVKLTVKQALRGTRE